MAINDWMCLVDLYSSTLYLTYTSLKPLAFIVAKGSLRNGRQFDKVNLADLLTDIVEQILLIKQTKKLNVFRFTCSTRCVHTRLCLFLGAVYRW